MSDSSYIAMQTPKRGLKSVGDPIYDGPEFKSPFSEPGYVTDVFWTVLLGPFRTFSAVLTGKLLWTMILVFLGSFLNGAVYVFVQSNANAAGTDPVLRSLILAIVGSSIYYVTSIWSYYDNLPTVIYPAQSFAMVALAFTRKKEETFAFVTACIYAGFQFLGYCMAGLALRTFAILNTTTPLYNVSVADQGYWIYWFGGTVIAFSFVFNRLFRQSPPETGGTDTATRASTAGALAIIFMTVGFYNLGIKSYSSGLFATQVLAYPNLPDTAANVNGVVPWAFYVFVDLFAVPATVMLLVLVLAFVQYLMKSSEKLSLNEAQVIATPTAAISTNMSSSARLTQRAKPVVQY